ncbi:hypothetical protein [Streptomyces sp. L7]|uniref:hypothetical protein n=1 Tax=Streptomyces sp. L7 TaxID=3423954 RepID=UPI003D98042E
MYSLASCSSCFKPPPPSQTPTRTVTFWLAESVLGDELQAASVAATPTTATIPMNLARVLGCIQTPLSCAGADLSVQTSASGNSTKSEVTLSSTNRIPIVAPMSYVD